MTQHTVQEVAAAQNEAINLSSRNWQSIRTLLEGATLVLVIWLLSSVNGQQVAMAKVTTQLEGMHDGMSALQLQLAGIPQLSQSMARIEVKLDEHERRISDMEGRSKK